MDIDWLTCCSAMSPHPREAAEVGVVVDGRSSRDCAWHVRVSPPALAPLAG